MEKRDNEIFMQSTSSRFLAMSCKLLRRAITCPPVSMGGLVPSCRARKKGLHKGRKQEYMFKSEAWTYILYNWQSTNLVFRSKWQDYYPIIYLRKQWADTRPGESKFFFIFFLVLHSRKQVATVAFCVRLRIVKNPTWRRPVASASAGPRPGGPAGRLSPAPGPCPPAAPARA